MPKSGCRKATAAFSLPPIVHTFLEPRGVVDQFCCGRSTPLALLLLGVQLNNNQRMAATAERVFVNALVLVVVEAGDSGAGHHVQQDQIRETEEETKIPIYYNLIKFN